MTLSVAHIGKAGWKDWNVARYASDGDLLLVTNNASDFRQTYAGQPLHAGLIIVIPAVGRGLQQRLFKAALDELAISSASRSTACWRSISTVMTSL